MRVEFIEHFILIRLALLEPTAEPKGGPLPGSQMRATLDVVQREQEIV